MKRLLILILVLGLTSAANANLLISVNGVVDPPDTEIFVPPSETAIIDIWGDGQESPQTTAPWLLVQSIVGGIDSINGHTMLYTGNLASYKDLEEVAIDIGVPPEEILAAFESVTGYSNLIDLSGIELMDGTPDPPPLEGVLVDDIIFHCEGPSEVLLILIGADLETVYDTQIIHQIPEPATICLLAVGALDVLRRRRGR